MASKQPKPTPAPEPPVLRFARPDEMCGDEGEGQGGEGKPAPQHLPLPPITDPSAFDCRVLTDEMAPAFLPGDQVTFSPRSDIPPGHPCYVRFTDDKETLAAVRFDHDDEGRSVVVLTHTNSTRPPFIAPRSYIAALAPAVRVTRQLV